MALDGVFKMKGATPQSINSVVTQVIESEKKYLPGPRIGYKTRIAVDKFKKEKHPDATFKTLVKGCNSPRQIRDLLRVARGEERAVDMPRSERAGTTCGQSAGDFFQKEHGIAIDTAYINLQQEVQGVVDRGKQDAIDKYLIPQTSAGVIGMLATKPMHPKWKRTEGPGQKWRQSKQECDMVRFGREFYETTGINCFSAAAKTSLFSGKPS